MNQDTLHGLLATLRPEVPEFRVILTGKSSRKVHGLYKPETREILLHNKNFTTDHELLYTAIHEFAHHVHFSLPSAPKSSKAHTTEFWAIFHELLTQAKQAGWYRDIFDSDPDFLELTRTLQQDYLKPHGELMKKFGGLLCQAMELCKRHGVPFEDYRDRILGLPRTTTKTAMTAFRWDVPTDRGFDAMKFLSGVAQPQKRLEMTQKLASGETIEQIKFQQRQAPSHQDFPENLEMKKKILKEKILQTEKKLQILFEELKKLESVNEGGT
ncbi:MAG: hypothetical protein HKM06_06645 [Spirochaetales bacterium]|nr:hypothetical protein [Spirochaetales bacterium]